MRDVIGDAEERHPDEPVEPERATRGPGLVDDLVDGLLGDAEVHERSPLLVRVVRGRWLPALASALPAILVTVLAVAACTVALMSANAPGSGDPLVEDLTFARWLRVVPAGVGMAFGGTFSAEMRGGEITQTNDLLFVPLTVTLLALAVLWICVRRFFDGTDPLADSIRTGAVFAAGIGAIAAFGRWHSGGEIEQFFDEPVSARTLNSAAPFKAMFWAFVLALAVTYAARIRLRVPLAVQGAVAGIVTGVTVSFGIVVALAYAYAGRVDAEPSDVTTVLPTAFGYAVNLGAAGFGLAAGGHGESPFQSVGVSLWESWVPGAYFALLLVPVLAVAAGVLWIVRYGYATREEAARACTLMAIPAALLWALFALAGSATYSLELFFVQGTISTGVSLWTALLVLAWFLVLGWIAGRLLLRGNLTEATDRRSLPLEAAEGPDSSGDPRR